MSDKLNISNRISGEETHIAFEGVIDEDANFTKIKSLKLNKLVFDFNNVVIK